MSNHTQEIYRLTPYLHLDGAPVIIESGVLLKDPDINQVFAKIKVHNPSEKNIIFCRMSILAYDENGDALPGISGFSYFDLDVPKGGSFGADIPVYMPNNTTRKISVLITEVMFSDNSSWESDEEGWEPVPAPQPTEKTIKKRKRSFRILIPILAGVAVLAVAIPLILKPVTVRNDSASSKAVSTEQTVEATEEAATEQDAAVEASEVEVKASETTESTEREATEEAEAVTETEASKETTAAQNTENAAETAKVEEKTTETVGSNEQEVTETEETSEEVQEASATEQQNLDAWKIKVDAINDSMYSSKNMKSLSLSSPIYVHYTMTDGKEGESTYVTVGCTYPDGVTEYFGIAPMTKGKTKTLWWEQGLWADPRLGYTGTLTVKFYDADSKEIGSASVDITK